MTNELDLLTRAEQALVQADHVPELSQIIDMAEAARVLAQRAHLGQVAENRAALIKLRAQRKAGELLTQMREDGTLEGHGGSRSHGATLNTLADLGVSKTQSSRWQQLAEYYTDDDLQLLAAKATEESESLSYKDLIRKIRSRNADASPPPAAPAPASQPAPERPGVTTLIEDLARQIFHLDADSTRVEIAALPDVERSIAIRLLVDAERWLHGLVSDYDRRRIDVWDELSEGVSNQRAIELRAELDDIFAEEHNIQPGDVVEHDGARHTIERAAPSDAPETEVHAAPAPDLGDAHASDPASTVSSVPPFSAEGAAASNPDRVLCPFPKCTLDDEHEGAHTVALDGYRKLPKDLSNAEAWARQQIETALLERPTDPEVLDLQQELYAGVDEHRATEILERLGQILELDDYLAPTSTPTERACRDLIVGLPADHPRVAEIQQMLYHGVNAGTAASIRSELKALKRQLVAAT